MDISYCNDLCPVGRKARDKFLAENNSAFDAATDFRLFVNECFKRCPRKAEHDRIAEEEKSENV